MTTTTEIQEMLHGPLAPNQNFVLHVLRNPYGYDQSVIREVAQAAANLIDEHTKTIGDLHAYAKARGLDTATKN